MPQKDLARSRALRRPAGAAQAPVTMTVRMRALRRARITGVVCGFSRFLMTSSPKRLRSCSTLSLKGRRVGSEATRRIRSLPPCLPCLGPRLHPQGQRGGSGPPGERLGCLQGGRDGQWLAREGHDTVAGGRVILQHLGEVGGHCQGESHHGVKGWVRRSPRLGAPHALPRAGYLTLFSPCCAP